MTSHLGKGPLTGSHPRPASIGTTRTGGASKSSEPAPQSGGFSTLLADLQARAQQLDITSQQIVDPGELRAAVDDARATLEGALSLGDQVLEAFYANDRRKNGATKSEGNSR